MQAAKKLEDKKIVLWGAGRLGKVWLDSLRAMGCEPAYFVDKSYAQIKADMPVKAPEALLAEDKSNLNIIITVSQPLYYDIESRLKIWGLADCLLAGDALKLYGAQWRCPILESTITTVNSVLMPCCVPFSAKPQSDINFLDYNDTIDRFLSMREKVRAEIRQNETRGYCLDCPLIELHLGPSDGWGKIDAINVNDRTVCNFRCMYCGYYDRGGDLPIPDYRLLMGALKKRGLLSDNVSVNIGPDEISAVHNCDDALSAFKEFHCCIFTNASIYQRGIQDILENGRQSFIITSVDCGARETFAKVKGRDAWDAVCRNLKKYSNNGTNDVRLKYIVLPGVNDNQKDADGFLRLCADVQASEVEVARNFKETKEGKALPESALKTLEYIMETAKSRGVPVKIFPSEFFHKDELLRLAQFL